MARPNDFSARGKKKGSSFLKEIEVEGDGPILASKRNVNQAGAAAH